MSFYDVKVPILLLTIFIILVIFCIMNKFMYYNDYNKDNIKFDNNDYNNTNNNSTDNTVITDTDIENSINNQINILFSNIEKNSKKQVKEHFLLDNSNISTYKNNLSKIQEYLSSLQLEDLQSIKDTNALLQEQHIFKKKEIVDLLTSVYIIRYIERLNQINAVSYKEFLKYQHPKKINFINNIHNHT